MTTKKQRREKTAAKTAARRESDRREALESLKRSRDKREQKLWDAQRSTNQRKAKEQIKAIATAKKNEEIPENLQASMESIIAITPEEQLLWDIFEKKDA